jgi:KamA family protein
LIMVKTQNEKYRPIVGNKVHALPQWEKINPEAREAVDVVSSVFPFRTNNYVVNELIDWDNVPEDPLYQLTFPQKQMLDEGSYNEIRELLKENSDKARLDECVSSIRKTLNPHPAGQLSHNVPMLDGKILEGVQHKYRETVLFFPSRGQTCHAYCSYCFRWPQFIGLSQHKFKAKVSDLLIRYLKSKPGLRDFLLTGGDPMVMKSKSLRNCLEPLLGEGLEHIRTIRIGTKSLAYWPYRYVTDADSDDVLRLFEQIVESGKHLAIMAHFSHPNELKTDIVKKAIRRIRDTGAEIRMQAPMIKHVNDKAENWRDLWTEGVRLGMIPYYLFVERDTGAREYFEIPLVRAHEIFTEAYSSVSGLARTVRGPSMSAFPGKILVSGIAEIAGEKVFVLHFLQARNPDWIGRPFFAKFDPDACWFDALRPAFGKEKFFFEE